MPNIAIIGSGPSGLGYIYGLINGLKKANLSEEELKDWKIDIFESSDSLGSGLPYNSKKSSPRHLLNLLPTTMVPVVYDNDIDNFYNWINNPTNAQKVVRELQKLSIEKFQKRFEKKFGVAYEHAGFGDKNFFDSDFEETNGYQKYVQNPEFINYIRNFRKFYQNLPTRYIGMSKELTFAPRVIMGMYLRETFNHLLDQVIELIGKDNVKLYINNLVTHIGEDMRLEYVQEGRTIKSIPYTNIAIGTGAWHEKYDASSYPNSYIRNVWPISNVENAVEELILNAESKGINKLNIAIEGSSLTAIDIARTIAEFKPHDIEMKINMVSRGGSLLSVRGTYDRTMSQSVRYFPQALKKLFKQRNIEFEWPDVDLSNPNLSENKFLDILKKANDALIQDIIRNNENSSLKSQGKIYLWQIAKLYSDTLAWAYHNNNLHEQEANTRKFSAFIEEKKGNYRQLLQEFKKMFHQDPFSQLKIDLERATIGDINGDLLSENILIMFIRCADFDKYLPNDEKFFKNIIEKSILAPYVAPMPPESARDLISLSDEGMLNVTSLGYNSSLYFENDRPYFLDSKGNRLDFDLAIDAKGEVLNFRKQNNIPPIYKSIAKEIKPFELVVAENDKQYKEIEDKYGTSYLSALSKREDGKYVVDNAIVPGGNIYLKMNKSQLYPEVSLLRVTVGVKSSSKFGALAAESFVDQFQEYQKLNTNTNSIDDICLTTAWGNEFSWIPQDNNLDLTVKNTHNEKIPSNIPGSAYAAPILVAGAFIGKFLLKKLGIGNQCQNKQDTKEGQGRN